MSPICEKMKNLMIFKLNSQNKNLLVLRKQNEALFLGLFFIKFEISVA